MSTAEQKQPGQDASTFSVIVLEEPIKRTGETITTLRLRKPRAGELRGLNLTDLANMKTDAVITLLPRISQPTLIAPEVEAMSPADLITCAMEVASFLAPKELSASVAALMTP